MSITQLPLLEEILQAHADALGRDYDAYRNHCLRVINFCVALDGHHNPPRALVIAAAFHDLGIWSDGTFDYLAPSEARARSYLAERDEDAPAAEIAAMIRNHHKITPCRPDEGELVEAFRRADWIDVTRGALKFGLPRGLVRDVFAALPDQGFHKRLAQLSAARLLSHPWNPLPMMRL